MAVRSMAAVCLAGQAMGGTPLESIEGVRIWDTPAIIHRSLHFCDGTKRVHSTGQNQNATRHMYHTSTVLFMERLHCAITC